ncbi:hypothetical protein N015_01490 [Pseudomonas asturiensis]|uniref:Uncharacterized protein n=1 Tax=Pseudomonas asturiensis TaxID=1190415 RepID=A0ABX6H6I1_9PSED|nr:hypothetical protein [Pseudomonas asturiensis]QHF01145.1 hypothetical protein N015_01490 [Pseudomonas asturiensis]
MIKKFLIIFAWGLVIVCLIHFLEKYLGETWLMALVSVAVVVALRTGLYLYRRSRGIKDPIENDSWF